MIFAMRHFSFTKFLYRNSPNSQYLYSFFGIFCLISTISTIYITHYELQNSHETLTLYFHQIMLIISLFFSLYTMWSSKIRCPLVVGMMWHIALIYNMTFCSTFFLLMSKFHNIQLMIFTLSLLLIFNLCHWKTALTMTVIGVGSALFIYKSLIGTLPASEMIDNNLHLLMYITLLVSTILIFFLNQHKAILKCKKQH